jgi:hypothetical protein
LVKKLERVAFFFVVSEIFIQRVLKLGQKNLCLHVTPKKKIMSCYVPKNCPNQKRSLLNEIAESCGLNPRNFSNRNHLCNAISATLRPTQAAVKRSSELEDICSQQIKEIRAKCDDEIKKFQYEIEELKAIVAACQAVQKRASSPPSGKKKSSDSASAMGAPPPPPPPPAGKKRSGPGASLMDDMKTTTLSNRASPSLAKAPSGATATFLEQIKQGQKLKKITAVAEAPAPDQTMFNQAMLKAVKQRRKALSDDDESSSFGSSSGGGIRRRRSSRSRKQRKQRSSNRRRRSSRRGRKN